MIDRIIDALSAGPPADVLLAERLRARALQWTDLARVGDLAAAIVRRELRERQGAS